MPLDDEEDDDDDVGASALKNKRWTGAELQQTIYSPFAQKN